MTDELKKAIELLSGKAHAYATTIKPLYEADKAHDAIHAAVALIESALTPSEEQEIAMQRVDEIEEGLKYQKVHHYPQYINELLAIVRSYIASPRADKTLEIVKYLRERARKTYAIVCETELQKAVAETVDNWFADIIRESEATK